MGAWIGASVEGGADIYRSVCQSVGTKMVNGILDVSVDIKAQTSIFSNMFLFNALNLGEQY